jgi:hypothetical protein
MSIFEELDRRRMYHLQEFGSEPTSYVLTENESKAFNLEASEKTGWSINQKHMKFRNWKGAGIYSSSELSRAIGYLEELRALNK